LSLPLPLLLLVGEKAREEKEIGPEKKRDYELTNELPEVGRS
jgi:hypothetical protein